MSGVTSRNEWVFGRIKENSFVSKRRVIENNVSRMLNKTVKMFEYEGLPETIPQKELELQLQVQGYTAWVEVNGNYYTCTGGLGGTPNPYYLPTIITIANPALRFDKSCRIDEDCVVILNDHLYTGLLPTLTHYCELLTEAELSLRKAIINARVPSLVEADNETARASAEEFFSKIVEGTDYGIIITKSSEMYEGIKSHDFYKQHYITEIIEALQYIKGSMYNEIGINAAFNMKREAIGEAEATLNEDVLYPTVDGMLEMREIGLAKVKDMYGIDVKVRLSSVWEQNREQDEIEMETRMAELESIEDTQENDESEGDDNENEDN